MYIDKEKVKKAVESGISFSFIPRRLKIASSPQLSNFPFNVVFMKKKIKNGNLITGTALYEPDLDTFEKNDKIYLMRYHNIYGGDCYLVIAFDEIKKQHYGQKNINGRSVGFVDGERDWKLFFINFTMLGLSNGEKCRFENLGEKIDKITSIKE